MLCFGHAAYAFVGDEIVESVSTVRKKVGVEACGEGVLLSSGKGEVGVLESKAANVRETSLVAQDVGSDENNF